MCATSSLSCTSKSSSSSCIYRNTVVCLYGRQHICMTCIVCACQGAWELARRVCMCVRVQLRVFMTHWILGPVCGRGSPVQEDSEQGAPSVTPPVNSDFHHRGHPLLCSLHSHWCLQSVFLFACFRVSPPLLLMGPCVGKKTEGRLRRSEWPGVDAWAVGWGVPVLSLPSWWLLFLVQQLAIGIKLQSIQSDLHVFKHF